MFSVLSSGGYGHIPLPLIRGEMKYHEPPEKFKQDFSFFGVYYRGTRGRSMDTLKKSIIKYNATYLFDQGNQALNIEST